MNNHNLFYEINLKIYETLVWIVNFMIFKLQTYTYVYISW